MLWSLMHSVIVVVIEIFHDIRSKLTRSKSLSEGGHEFQYVEILQTSRLRRAIRFAGKFIFIMHAFFLAPTVFYFYLADLNYSTEEFLSFGQQVLIVSLMFTCAAFIMALFNNPNMTYSGLGLNYDVGRRRRTKYSIIVNSNGIHGLMDCPWSKFSDVVRSGPLQVALSFKHPHRVFLKHLSEKEIRIAFSSDTEADQFKKIALKFIER